MSHAQTQDSVFIIEYNINRRGSDIREGFPVINVGECMNECAFSSECVAFTWVDVGEQPPSYDNDKSLCWLKNSVPSKNRNLRMNDYWS